MDAQHKTDPATEQLQNIKRVALLIAMGADPKTIQLTWERIVDDAVTSGLPFDVEDTVQQAIRESYVQATDDLKSFAEKVKFFNTCKKVMREYSQKLKDLLAAEEQRLQSLDDFSALAALELQKAAEEQQVFAQRIANIQKELTSNAREILDNLKK